MVWDKNCVHPNLAYPHFHQLVLVMSRFFFGSFSDILGTRNRGNYNHLQKKFTETRFQEVIDYIIIYGYGSIPINTIFSGMNIHLPAILMLTRGTRFWHTAISNVVKTIINYPWLGMFYTTYQHGNLGMVIIVLTCSPQPPGSLTLKQHIQTIWWYAYHQRMNENTGYTQWFWL